jgi:hypothetical protein
MTTGTFVTVTSTVAGIAIGNDADGLPIRLTVGDNNVPEDAWQAWLCANANSRLIADGKVRRIERCRQ